MAEYQEPSGEPGRRQWAGYWSMIVQQTQNAFNDKAAQFILIPLGGIIGFNVESIAGLMIAIPFIIFAPLAGWTSDRFSKRNVILGAAIAQILILSTICLAVFIKWMPLALFGFFLLAVQSAFFSPAKIGINKELVGSKHLGFAAGVQQMLAMLAILAGQIIAGWWYDKRYISLGAEPEFAWQAALFPLLLLTCLSVPAVAIASSIPRVPAQGKTQLSGRLLISHFKDLKELWAHTGLRRAALGVAYFWGFAAFINLWSVKVARSLTNGGEGFGTLSSIFMAYASLGMVLGFGFASWLLRKRIELGWVPLSGVFMTVSSLILATLQPGGVPFLICLGLVAFSAALFLAPLNAWMQDRYPPDKRGEMQAAVNLQDCFAGIIAVVFIEAMIWLAWALGIPEIAGFRLQLLLIGISCGVMTWFVLRLLPADFIRLICLAAIRTLYRIKVTGSENIPATGGALLLPNHVTFADAFYLSTVTERPVRFVMDETFMANKMVSFGATLFGTVPIRRDQPLEAIRHTISALGKGDLVVLFPEGQLTRTGALCELERGFELIARKAKCPILPVWLDGSWGSIFSFERWKFFRKIPYSLPYGLSIAVGETINSEKPARRQIQEALLETSTAALMARHPISTSACLRNAHQLTQSAAIPRKAKIFILKSDSTASALLPVLKAFVKITKGELHTASTYQNHHDGLWVGGEDLWKQIPGKPNQPVFLFNTEFEGDAAYQCFALEGLVVSISMPHPPKPKDHSEFQAGHKPGSFGKLLPGWHIKDGTLQPGNLPWPAHLTIDEENFVVPKNPES